MKYRFEKYPSSYRPDADIDELCFVTDIWDDYGYHTTFHANLYLQGTHTDMGFVTIGFNNPDNQDEGKSTYDFIAEHRQTR